MELRVCHLYPDLLNLYGDRGNLIALRQRCLWRGIDCSIQSVSMGEKFIAADYDLVFLGGGQDYEQNILQDDFIRQKGQYIRQAVEDELVFLCICGGYQLMGRYYEEPDGRKIACLGAIDVWTIGHKQRLTGNTLARCEFLGNIKQDPLLVGFENHAGRTWLGDQVKPLAMVLKGKGNNGQDKTEGAIYKNVYCTYYHGSFLPKNPAMADYLIETALIRRYGSIDKFNKLDDTLAENARQYNKTCK